MIAYYLRSSRTILAVVLLSCLASFGVAFRGLPFSSDRTHLLPANDPRQLRFERYRTAFPNQGSETVIVLEGHDAPIRLRAALALASVLNADGDWFGNALGGLAIPRLRETALFFLSESQRADLVLTLRRVRPWLAGMGPPRDKALLAQLEACMENRGRWTYQSPYGPRPPALEGELPLAMGDSNLVLVQVRSRNGEAAFARLESHLREIRQRFPGLTTQVSGDYAVRTDDAATARWSAVRAVVLAMVLVKVLFLLVFGESRRAGLAFLSLFVGMGWAAAFAAVTVGRLNLITVNFLATLVGLGMDFALHLVYRYEEELALDPERAWERTFASAGRENLLGALATSAAFFSLCLTGFSAVAELGWISGFGVLFCFVSIHLVLPLLLVPPKRGPAHLRLAFLSAWEEGWLRRRHLVLPVALLATLAALWGCRYLRFDANLLHMARPGAVSIQSNETFRRQGKRSVLYAVSLCPDQATMVAREQRFRSLPQVATTLSLSRLLVAGNVSELLRLARDLPAIPSPHLRSANELLALKKDFAGISSGRLGSLFASAGPGPIQDGLYSFEKAVDSDIRERTDFLRAQTDRALGLSDLPTGYRERFLGRGGEWLIQVYPSRDVWEKEELDRFLAAVRSVDPDATGMPTLVQSYLAVLSECYFQAGRNAFLTILVLLLLYFRSLSRAAWAMLPKLLGSIWMFGLLGWLGIPLNPANATALPLTLGVGLVFGVHVVHRLLEGGATRVFQGSTGAALAVSGLSTICGYLGLLASVHRGIESLGVVMALGVGANLVAALVVLPCLLNRR